MNKLIWFCLCASLVFGLLGTGNILAKEIKEDLTKGPDLKIDGFSAVLMEPSSGEILFCKDPDRKLPPASVTKLMVMLLALEAIDRGEIKLTDVISASPEACRMGGSQIWLEPGEEMTVADLLKAVCIVSANDASYALGEHLAGSEENFITLMNKRAGELGLKNTHFVNTTGLEPDGGGIGNLTSAREMAILAREVIKHPIVFKWTSVWIDSLRDGKSFLRNTNKLVRFFRGCDGLKTGYTDKAGYCLVATAQREGVRMIAVVMKSSTIDSRSRDISTMFNYGFSQYKAYRVCQAGDIAGQVKVFRGKETVLDAVVPRELTAILKRNQKGEVIKKVKLDRMIAAPVKKGQIIGEVVLTYEGKPCGRMELVAAKDVARAGFFELWGQIIRKIFGLAVGSRK
ncbi:MAG: D-alanyl-D-alanine carboxypeptidase [Firmicutes bacterium]|nr:D-alanyl-D-alanine carboxypeptidase [Bacillota bacterium]